MYIYIYVCFKDYAFYFKCKQTLATYFLYFRVLSTLVRSFHIVLGLFLFYSVCVLMVIYNDQTPNGEGADTLHGILLVPIGLVLGGLFPFRLAPKGKYDLFQRAIGRHCCLCCHLCNWS